MKSRYIVMLTAICSAWSLAAHADRDPGWEFGGEVIYQDSKNISADGGSSAAIDSDVGLALTFGYRVSERLEVNFGLDWNNVDYKANLISADLPNLSASVDGELESFTPRVGVNFNFLEGPITPFVNDWLQLYRHLHPGRPAANRLLVGPLVRPDLRHLAEHPQCRRVHLWRGRRCSLGHVGHSVGEARVSEALDRLEQCRLAGL